MILVPAGPLLLAAALFLKMHQQRTAVLVLSAFDPALYGELRDGEGFIEFGADAARARLQVRMERQAFGSTVAYVFTVLDAGGALEVGTRIGVAALERQDGAMLLCGDACTQLGLPTMWQARRQRI